jgi:hypothetical protein
MALSRKALVDRRGEQEVTYVKFFAMSTCPACWITGAMDVSRSIGEPEHTGATARSYKQHVMP